MHPLPVGLNQQHMLDGVPMISRRYHAPPEAERLLVVSPVPCWRAFDGLVSPAGPGRIVEGEWVRTRCEPYRRCHHTVPVTPSVSSDGFGSGGVGGVWRASQRKQDVPELSFEATVTIEVFERGGTKMTQRLFIVGHLCNTSCSHVRKGAQGWRLTMTSRCPRCRTSLRLPLCPLSPRHPIQTSLGSLGVGLSARVTLPNLPKDAAQPAPLERE